MPSVKTVLCIQTSELVPSFEEKRAPLLLRVFLVISPLFAATLLHVIPTCVVTWCVVHDAWYP